MQLNFNGSNIFGTMEIRLSHWGLIMAPVQEPNSDNFREIFSIFYSDCMLSVLIRIASMKWF